MAPSAPTPTNRSGFKREPIRGINLGVMDKPSRTLPSSHEAIMLTDARK